MITVAEIRERFDQPAKNLQPRAACGTHRGQGGCCQKNAYSIGGAFLICINARPKSKDEQYLRFPYISALAVGLMQANPELTPSMARPLAEIIVDLNDSSCFERAWLALDIALRLKPSAKHLGQRRDSLSTRELLLRVNIVREYDANAKSKYRKYTPPANLAERFVRAPRRQYFEKGPRYYKGGGYVDCSDWTFSNEDVLAVLASHLRTAGETVEPASCCPNCGWALRGGEVLLPPVPPPPVVPVAVEELVREPEPAWLL